MLRHYPGCAVRHAGSSAGETFGASRHSWGMRISALLALLAVSALLPHLPAGVDGEAVTLPTPLEFRVLPGALRVLVPPTLGPPAPRVQPHRWATVRRLARLAAGSAQPD